MSFVGVISEEQAGPDLRPIYRQIRSRLGFLPNYFLALGRDPQFIAHHLSFDADIMKDGAVPRTVKERVGLVVSGINSSSYCVALHMELLRALGIEKGIGRKLATNYSAAPFDAKEQALYRFAEKLTRKPFDIERADVDAVRQAGWDDAAIYETVLAAAYFNFLNRVTIGLGLVADF